MVVKQSKNLTDEYRRLLGDLKNVEARLEAMRDAVLEVQELNRTAADLRMRMGGLAVAMRFLDPDWLEPTEPMRRRNVTPWGLPPGGMIREALKVLGSETEPLSALEIAERVAAPLPRGSEFNRAEINRIATRVARGLQNRRPGLIQITGTRPMRFSLIQR